VNLERIITDNRDAYRSHAFREACAAAGLRRLRANGKAERFMQTVLRECA
jgi:transposase InsO family protein